MIVFKRTYIDGPLDGLIETITREGLEVDVTCTDGADRAHHYRLASLPTDQEPIEVSYRYVGEFDPRSDYVEKVGAERFGEILDPRPDDG